MSHGKIKRMIVNGVAKVLNRNKKVRSFVLTHARTYTMDKLGKHEKALLEYLTRYQGQWHTIHQNMRKQIKSLTRKNLIRYSQETQQAILNERK